jgi:putative PIN family toxin of toxin-antitoxin system
VRIVLDTNVLVSALLTPQGLPAQILLLALAGDLTLLFDERILEEYREVLHRPRFAIPRDQLAEILEQLEADGELVATTPVTAALPDPDDRPFIEVAMSGRADALVTGNCGTSRRTSASSCCHRELYCSDSIPSRPEVL